MPLRVDTDELLAYGRAGAPPHTLTPLDRWLRNSPRFAAFAETYRDKIRKKLRAARDDEGLRDVLCELETAYCLLREPRFDVAYEAHAITKTRAPDLTLTYRTHTVMNVEVARVRSQTALDAERLLNLVCGKLGQMLAGSVNVLVTNPGVVRPGSRARRGRPGARHSSGHDQGHVGAKTHSSGRSARARASAGGRRAPLVRAGRSAVLPAALRRLELGHLGPPSPLPHADGPVDRRHR